MFILKYCSSKKGWIYVCFVDFKKIFDKDIHASIDIVIGVGTIFHNIIKSMCSHNRSCIRITRKEIIHFFRNNSRCQTRGQLEPTLIQNIYK